MRRRTPNREPFFTSVSPQEWGLVPAGDRDLPVAAALGLPASELESRARNNTFAWLPRQFDEEAGAFHGFYDARSRTFAPPQNVNLIAPFQCLAAFDRFGDERFLDMARRSADWLEGNLVETHPMSLVLGGVLDNIKRTQLWTKYTADWVVLNLSLWKRLQKEVYLERALQGSRFLLQSQNHAFAPKYDHWQEKWIADGWQSFGRAIIAMIALQECTGDEAWLERAAAWAEYGLTLQADTGCFHLINGTYYSSDIAADEIRGLIRTFIRTGDNRFLDAGLRFADWHLGRQAANGSWPLSEDRWGVEVGAHRGPGDMPNIAIALLLAHRTIGDARYVLGAARALRYSIAQQQLPGTGRHYVDDPVTHWGFWSWDPPYDYTMSADQSTHHVRGYWFFLDYLASLDTASREELRQAAAAAKDRR
jgi:hypothetical protein